MTKTVGNVATDLQTIAHEGFADIPVYIKRLDAMYKVGKVKLENNGLGSLFCIIEAKGLNEE